MTRIKLYTAAEFDAYQARIQREPGAAWYCPWYYDPARPRERVLGFLSEHYLRDWATIRPPIVLVCPNGRHWCPDQKSSNGTGWTVTGDLPDITASPSIVVPGYHGFLRDGAFTEDIEGRGQNGVSG